MSLSGLGFFSMPVLLKICWKIYTVYRYFPKQCYLFSHSLIVCLTVCLSAWLQKYYTGPIAWTSGRVYYGPRKEIHFGVDPYYVANVRTTTYTFNGEHMQLTMRDVCAILDHISFVAKILRCNCGQTLIGFLAKSWKILVEQISKIYWKLSIKLTTNLGSL